MVEMASEFHSVGFAFAGLGHPVLGAPQVNGVVRRHRCVGEHDFVADGGPHAQMVPGWIDDDAGAVSACQEVAYEGRVTFSARPDREPVQTVEPVE